MRQTEHVNAERGGVRSRRGITLVEVVIGLALTALLCIGVATVGIRARRFGEHNRVAGEAQCLAKQRIEEIVAAGRGRLAQPTYTLPNTTTSLSSRGYTIICSPAVVWHDAAGQVVGVSSSAYAEVYVDAKFWSPLAETFSTNRFAILIQ